VEKHQLIPVVDEVFSLEKGNDALRRMEDGAQFGKLVLKVG
jgi:zinc-binding alcohol dehydrogenase/oxidoreductase